MPDFSNGVATPGGASYMAPLLNFQQFAQWPQQYEQGVQSQQQQQAAQQIQQLRQQQIQQGDQQAKLAQAFPNGLPTDPNTGQIDYRQVAATLAKFGDVSDAVTMLQQQPAPLSPMFGGPQAPGQPQAQGAPAAPQGQPASVQARPLPPPAANAPKGDSGQNTLTSLVTDRLPAQNQTTGQTIMKIAEVMGIDPNADLTPGQAKRAQGLLQKYAPEMTGTKVADASGRTGALPPSANAGTPAATPAQPSGATPVSFSDRFAAAGGGRPAQPSPEPQPAPQAPQQASPIVPQVPLPKGFTDPVAASQALRTEAARLSQYPKAQGQVSQLNAWADRIDESIKPISIGSQSTLVDPRTGKVVAQGAGAAALANTESGTTLDADAENYRQTGKLPPNMGRGIQGATEARRVRERAAELEVEQGGDPADWASRWQSFGAQAAGSRILASRATNLRLAENEASTLIPRVREISDKINRTQYPTLNSLIMAAEKGSGGEDVVKYGLAVSSLIPVYARVLKPTGQITEGDTHRATEILDKAWSKGQINAALDQMQLELKSAKDALQKTIDESSGGSKRKADTSSSTSTPKGASKPDADGWVTLPNGARIREMKSGDQ